MDRDRLETLIRQIFLELGAALQAYSIMTALRSSGAEETYRRYEGFFGPTWMALVYVLAVKLHNITSKSQRGPNLHRAWEELEKAGLTDSEELADLRNQLSALQSVLSKVVRLRHQGVAHHEMGAVLPRLPQDEIRPLLTLLSLITERTGFQVGLIFTFEIPDQHHVNEVLRRLSGDS